MSNRRKFFRFEVPLNLAFKPHRGQIPFSFGRTRNFSRKGFCFQSDDFDYPQEQVLEFKVEMPGADVIINVLGDIVWSRRIGETALTGVRLRDMHTESRWKILDYCYQQWILIRKGNGVN